MLQPKQNRLYLVSCARRQEQPRRELDTTGSSAATKREQAGPHACGQVLATPKPNAALDVGGTEQSQARAGSRRRRPMHVQMHEYPHGSATPRTAHQRGQRRPRAGWRVLPDRTVSARHNCSIRRTTDES